MKTIQISTTKITVELTKEELGVITNALNEVCNGIDVWEFDTRMGIDIKEARSFLELLTSTYKRANRTQCDSEASSPETEDSDRTNVTQS